MVFLLILCWQTYPDVAKASTHNICTLYIDPLLLFISAWSQSWLHFVVLLPPTKNFCITPCLPILVELIGLVNSAMIFLSQVILLRWLTYLLGSQTLILTVLLFWKCLFFLTLVFLKLGSGEFRRNASNLFNKGKYAIPPLFNGQEILSSASDKVKLFAENFSKNSDLDGLGISLRVLSSRTNLKLHISLTPKVVKKDHNESWYFKGIWSLLYCNCGSKGLWVRTFVHTSSTLQ